MSKSSQSSLKPVYTNYYGPTLQELQLLLDRIEQLDAKFDETIRTKEAA
jgi:hypothetical protein